MPDAGELLLELSQVSKYFGGVRALHDVDLQLHRGEVVALVGDNGAGKSTLIKVISGVEHPDSGVIRVRGETVRLETPRAAQNAGIHTVHQDLSLCDNLDAVRNLYLGQEITGGLLRGRPVSRHRMEVEARKVLDSLAVRLRSLTTPVGGLSGGQRQGIAICRALISDPSLVLLDEPTAALGVTQRAEVLDLILRLKSQNRGVLVISHDLKDVQEVADRVVVMRLGCKVAEFERGDYTSSDLIAAITGAHEAPLTVEGIR
ncbi:ATP-binding cassette domain-containing protein [Nocardioides sp. LHD-245]|uniref:ATP-binding cassette domain-containing protein n=1 Tax=Nocardioides sp. LHD-245 TaxID=3051387 RepID=UPI0027DF9660|nr:ATP-binding cassette domain-containing protein [Nocardioides sp. LHD-245]